MRSRNKEEEENKDEAMKPTNNKTDHCNRMNIFYHMIENITTVKIFKLVESLINNNNNSVLSTFPFFYSFKSPILLNL